MFSVPASAETSQRQLLVFASAGNAALAAQRQLLATSAEALRERDLAVIEITGFDRAAAAMRTRYKVASTAFAVLLIGKDGGVKLRSSEPVRPERLFAIIDAMPMRQEEMRRRLP